MTQSWPHDTIISASCAAFHRQSQAFLGGCSELLFAFRVACFGSELAFASETRRRVAAEGVRTKKVTEFLL